MMETVVRRFLVVLVVAALLLASGCSSGTDSNSDAGGAPASEPGFPTTVTAANGPVQIERRPERVVVLSDQLVETAVAIGVHPVGAPAPGTPLGPWTAGTIDQGDASMFSIPTSGGIEPEKVAAFAPDLIIGTDYLLKDGVLAQMEQVAPTIVLSVNAAEKSDAAPWETSARIIGQATGRSEQAGEVIDQVKARIAQFTQQNQQAAGKTYQLGNFLSESQFVCTNSDVTSSAMFLDSLGLKLATLPGTGTEARVVLSKERFTDLNDVGLVIMGARDAGLAERLTSDPLFTSLTPVQNQTANQVDLTWVTAYNIPTVLSIPALLDQLEPYVKRL